MRRDEIRWDENTVTKERVISYLEKTVKNSPFDGSEKRERKREKEKKSTWENRSL